ncbi:hypothetical protein AURDEDRAFT_174991 [Auricularia subglabra TFB-10046 SS5]|nr:hypothetical protein AURDEDRAFT_174991 [Auricularia subglabra TFB-10046 SS5]
MADVTTKDLSTAPYSASNAAILAKSLQALRRNATAIDGLLTASVARLWAEQCRSRMNHVCGVRTERMVYERRMADVAAEPPCYLYQLVGLLLLFNEPHSFYRILKGGFADASTLNQSWTSIYHSTLCEEWKDHAFLASVSLAANVAFLSVVGCGSGNRDSPPADSHFVASHVLSLCSTMFSIGSIVISTSLPNFHRRLQCWSGVEMVDYLTLFMTDHDGLYKVAMLLSLPFAFFMWSLVLFVAALISLAADHWTWSTGIPIFAAFAAVFAVLAAATAINPPGEAPADSALRPLRYTVDGLGATC